MHVFVGSLVRSFFRSFVPLFVRRSFIRSFVPSFVRSSFLCSFLRSFVHSSFICSFICLFVRLSVCSFVRSSVRSFVRSFVHSSIRSFICSFVRPSVRSFVRSYLEWRGGVTGPGAEVEGQQQVDTALGAQHGRVRRVERQTPVHHIQLLDVRRVHLKYTIKLVWNNRNNRLDRLKENCYGK